MTTLVEDAAELRIAKSQAAELDAAAKQAKEHAQRLELDFFARMDAEAVESIKYDGTLFVPSSTVYGQVQDRSEFVQWAQENAPELLETKERKALLNELIREHLDNNQELPPGLGFYVKEYVSQRVS